MKKNQTFYLSLFIVVMAVAILACQATYSFPQAILTESEPSGDTPDEPKPTRPPKTEEIEPQPTLSSAPEAKPVFNDDLITQQDALVELYQNVSPGVVAILIYADSSEIFSVGSGSGFVIDKKGHIATNFHVVQNASQLIIYFPSGIKVRGEVIGTDPDSDLAIIKVDLPEKDLIPLPLGDSDKLQVGQLVVAIGNPFGLRGTMTTGIVSSISRTLESLNESPGRDDDLVAHYFTAGDIIQTDAAINPGNSGGPLLNLNGEVIGINRAIFTVNTNPDNEPVNSGIGFAVSVNMLKRVAPSLIKYGTYDYPYFGVGTSVTDIPLSVAEDLGLDPPVGGLITDVTPGGPADKAGMQNGDVVLRIGDTIIYTFDDIINYLYKYTSPGDKIEVLVFREGKELKFTVELEARP
jgi:S1-C subfamily serine protease